MMEIDVNQGLTIRFEAGSMKGEPGTPGITPHIGDNGNWFSGETDTGVPATGPAGKEGSPGKDGYTPIKGKDYFDGQPGKDGYTPVKGVDYFDGQPGAAGKNGVDGKDGYTPVKGKDYFDGQPGQPGADGKDGITPVVAVSDITGGHRVTITTGSNVQTFDVLDGKNGSAGSPGSPGKDGVDGLTPAVSVTEIEGGHRVTITTGEDVQSFNVLDGKDGEDAEGGTVEVDHTLTIEGMAADAKAVGDAIKAIGSGGAQVQSDYAQHDATQPDYIKNRPLWQKSTPILLNETTGYSVGDFASYGVDGIKTYPAPVEGKRYTFCAVGGNVYTGVAVSGEFDVDGSLFPGIGIVDEQGRDALAVHIELGSMTGWFVKIPEFVVGVGVYNTTPLVIIEGESAYNKRTVPDDVIMSGEGMNIVYEFKNLQENPDYIQALLNDVEIVVDLDGTEITFTMDNMTVMGDPNDISQGVMYFIGSGTGEPIAMLIPMDETGASFFLVLVAAEGLTVKSFKANYPGIFAPVVEAKKIPDECMPGAFIAYTDAVSNGTIPGIWFESALYNIARYDDVMQAFKSGRPMYVCIVSDTGETSSYYTVLRVDEKGDNVYLRYLYDDMTIRSCVAS